MHKFGNLVMEALDEEQVPLTIDKIVLNIALKTGVEANNRLKQKVTNAVEGSVRFGYVTKRRGKYVLENDDDDDSHMPSCSMIARRSGSPRRSASRRRRSQSRQSRCRSRRKH